MYPKHVGHENGGCGHLGGAPLSRPTAVLLVATHAKKIAWSLLTKVSCYRKMSEFTILLIFPCSESRDSKRYQVFTSHLKPLFTPCCNAAVKCFSRCDLGLSEISVSERAV